MKNSLKSTFTTLGAVLAMIPTGMLEAAPAVYEPFNYAAGNLHGKSGSSEIGLGGTWDAKVETGHSTAVTADSLYGAYASLGGKVGPTSAGANKYGGSRAISSSALSASGLLNDGATLWMSVVMGYGSGANLTNAKLAVALANDNFSSGNYDYWIKDAGSQSGEGVGVVLGRFSSTNGRVVPVKFQNLAAGDDVAGNINGTWTGAGTALTSNQYALYVVKFTWGANSSLSDTIEVYKPNGNLTLGSAISTLSNVTVNQSAFDTLTFSRGDVVVLDEVRFGASYADVAPPDVTGPVLVTKNPTGANGFLPLQGTFDANVIANQGNIRIYNSNGPTLHSTNAVTDTSKVSISGMVMTITPSEAFTIGQSYYVEMDAGTVKDAAGNNLAGFVGASTWSFDISSLSYPNGDPDGDGLTNATEKTLGSNPLLADSDGDGLSDGYENTHGTNLLVADSDGDGYSDGAEFTAGSNPLLAASKPGDIDADGLPDTWETTNFGDLSHDGTVDTDDDLLIDSLEFTLNLNPNDPDTDHDGHPDWMGIPGYLYVEQWNNITGANLQDLFASTAFNGTPSDVYLVTQAKAQTNVGDNYGLRMTGRVIAPVTGAYHFWIAGDGPCKLYLSSDSTAFKRKAIASVAVASGVEQWDLNATQKSAAINLVAGQEYYIEALMKESTGADHLALAWDYPGQARQLIPGAKLRSYIVDAGDADGDGMLDTWETSVGLNPNDNGSTVHNQSAYADIDGDGLLNFEEYNYSGNPQVAGGNAGYLDLDVWNGITGSTVKNLIENSKYAMAPDLRMLSGADLSGLGSNYGARLRGTLTAPQTGDYVFTIAGDEQAELWISSTDSSFAKRKIAYSTTKTNYQQWTTGTRQSAGIHLQQGQSYYIEALVKNASGSDHLSIGWSRIAQSEWQESNIGSGTTSTWNVNSGTGSATGTTTGGDIRYASDKFTFRNVQLQGDCEMVARIPEMASTNALAKAGVMIRSSLAADSTFAMVFFHSDRRINVSYRSTTGAQSAGTGGLSAGQPYQWVKLSRVGSVFTGSYSLDGLTWKSVGTCTVPMGQTVYVGMATASGANNVQVSAEWDYVGFTDLSRVTLIPSSALTSFPPNPLDLDDDNLPDAWEITNGLNATSAANGMGQYGDPDGDHVSNYDEYLLESDPLSNGGIAGNLTRELWPSLNRDTFLDVVTTTTFLQGSSQISLLSGSEQLTLGNTGGTQRVRGSVTAPVTGDYRFWISGYSDCELWLSDSGASKFGKRKLAWLLENDPGGAYLVGFRSWDTYATQRTELVHLQAGQKYFIEVLQMHSQGSGHFSVAWNYTDTNGQTTSRGLIPATQLKSFEADLDDADDDYLPNSWETATGLNPTDNGLTDRVREGEYGDFDNDVLTNREEYLLGTNPANSDTDGDGWNDFDEVYIYGTNPLFSNEVSFAAITMPPPSQYAAATGGWTFNPNGSLSAWDRRGTITYSFTLTEPGVHEVKLIGAAIGTLRTVENLPIVFSMDGNLPFASTTLASVNGGAGTAKAITPWLSAGTHTLTILHDNYRADRRLRIDSVQVNRLGGEDLDEDGVPDWVKEEALAANALTQAPAQSRTSPVCVEGRTQNISSASLSVLMQGAQQADAVSLHTSINDEFYADVPLSATGAVTLNASLMGGFITETKSISWTATNLFDSFAGNALHIRKNDSLRLDAWSGTDADGQTFTVTLNGNLLADNNQNTTHTSGEPFVATFATAGTFTLVATHGSQTASVTLQVHAANFGPEFIVSALQPRTWTPTLLDSIQKVQADKHVSLYETTANPQTGPRTFSVGVSQGANFGIISRLPGNMDGAPSAIVASGTIHGVYLAHADETSDAMIVTQYPDGTWLMSSSFVAVNLPANVIIQITATQQGTLFTNGSNVMELHSSDFDANGVATVYFEWSGTGAPKLCHITKTYIQP